MAVTCLVSSNPGSQSLCPLECEPANLAPACRLLSPLCPLPGKALSGFSLSGFWSFSLSSHSISKGHLLTTRPLYTTPWHHFCHCSHLFVWLLSTWDSPPTRSARLLSPEHPDITDDTCPPLLTTSPINQRIPQTLHLLLATWTVTWTPPEPPH